MAHDRFTHYITGIASCDHAHKELFTLMDEARKFVAEKDHDNSLAKVKEIQALQCSFSNA